MVVCPGNDPLAVNRVQIADIQVNHHQFVTKNSVVRTPVQLKCTKLFDVNCKERSNIAFVNRPVQ